jgi:hypothetical protein
MLRLVSIVEHSPFGLLLYSMSLDAVIKALYFSGNVKEFFGVKAKLLLD